MQILNITQRRFDTLKPLELPRDVFNTEAQMYMIPGKNRWSKKQTVLKKLYHDNGEIFSNKLYTINELIDKSETIGVEELVMPEALAAIDNDIVGFTMPFIPNINFQEVLNSREFTNEQKIAYLKEIGELLEKLKKVRKYTNVKGFYLNDIHENNFVLNTTTGRINVVDLDSCKIGNNLTAAAVRYLTPASQLASVSKYITITSPAGGCFETCDNTEIYCYIVMIFNFFFGSNIGKLSIPEFYVYLEYLSKIGISRELLDKIECIYTGKANENPYEYLDELGRFYGRTHKNVFERVREKRF